MDRKKPLPFPFIYYIKSEGGLKRSETGACLEYTDIRKRAGGDTNEI
jgi:hypothetical protein